LTKTLKQPSEKHTFCPKLWEEFFIVEDGTVFPCCERPMVVGNIYNNNTREIYNSPALQKMRKQSLTGKLPCYKNCRLLQKKQLQPNYSKKVKASYGEMKKLRMLFSEKCNLNCRMCHQNSNCKTVLSMDIMKKNIDLEPIETIDSQGGESLFIKEANEFFDYAVKKGKKVSLLTNCMLVNDLWAEKIALHSDFVHISLNSPYKKTHELINRGSNWERVLANIQRIRKAKAKHNTNLNIIGHMTITLQNLNEIPEFIRQFKNFGFDTANFGFTRSVQYYLKFNPWKRKSLSKKIKQAIQETETEKDIDALRLELLKLV